MRQLTGPLEPLGYVSDGTWTAAKALSAVSGGIPAGTEVCWISATGANVRYRVDSTASSVTATTGHRLPSDGEPREFSVAQANAMYLFQEAATATVTVTWFKHK